MQFNPTGDIPIMLRNGPDAQNKAKASTAPIPTAMTNALETDGNLSLSAITLESSLLAPFTGRHLPSAGTPIKNCVRHTQHKSLMSINSQVKGKNHR